MGIKKQYLKTKSMCKVTFRIDKNVAGSAIAANLVGDFNDWNIEATPMKGLKNGAFTVTMDLEPQKEYQFRYLLDKTSWMNDWDADKYIPTIYGDSENSVIVI